jgi:DNA modification methylase
MTVKLINGDCRAALASLPAASVQCVVTSPPYFGLRDYGVGGQIGLEITPEAYIAELVSVFRDIWRVLRDDGVAWLNLGDSYNAYNGNRGASPSLSRDHGPILPSGSGLTVAGLKPKDLLMIPARVALALQADGWFLRQENVWSKPNPMPESVTDRPSCAHEKVFLLTKSARYYYDADAVRLPMADSSIARLSQNVDAQDGSPRANGGAKTNGPMKAVGGKQRGHGRRHDGFNDRWDAMTKTEQQLLGANLRNVWTIATQPFSGSHFATMPPALAEICIKAGSRPGDTILDPFGGAGTTGLVADRLNRNAILIEINSEYVRLAHDRIHGDSPLFAEVA